MKLTQRIREMFDLGPLKKHVQSLDQRQVALAAEISELQSKRDRIMHAPAARSDIRTLVESWVDERGKGWAGDVMTTLKPLIMRPQSPTSKIRWNSLSVVDPADPYSTAGAADAKETDRMLCALFRDQVVGALHAAIDAAEWPSAEGLPFDTRANATRELDERLRDLVAEQERLQAESESLGLHMRDGFRLVNLSPAPNPPKGRTTL